MSQTPYTWNGQTLAEWRDRGSFETFGGHKIFVAEAGDQDAPAIVFVHGFPTASWDFAGMWQLLEKDYHLLAIDMLGFGFSDKPNRRNYTIHGQADLFNQFIESRGLEQYHVLAHDYGDTVAQEMLARQNEGNGVGQWLSGCFLNGGLFPETHKALLIQKLLLSPLGPLLNRFSGYSKFSESFSRVFGEDTKPTEAELRAFWSLINENDGKHVFHNLITYMRDRKQHRERWLSAVVDASCPLGLINGSVDPVSGAHMVARYKTLGGRLDFLTELPALGHYPQVESAEQVTEAYRRFLAGVTESRSAESAGTAASQVA